MLQNQPESATVPQTEEHDGSGAVVLNDAEAPATREAWSQTGFGVPLPRPFVRYGAVRSKPESGRHPSIPSRYGAFGAGHTQVQGRRQDAKRHGKGGAAWLAGKGNPRRLQKPPMPRPMIVHEGTGQSVESGAHWRARAAERERLALGHAAEEKATAEKVVATAVANLQGQQAEQAERLKVLTAQLGAERLRHQLAQSHARNTELLERINEASHVGVDLRNELTQSSSQAPAAHAVDARAADGRATGVPTQAGQRPPQPPLYFGYVSFECSPAPCARIVLA